MSKIIQDLKNLPDFSKTLVMIDDNTPINANKTKKRQLSDLCDGEIDQPIKPKRSYNKKGGRRGHEKK
ncbi:unnamed protein product [Rhizophagus irregularis]|nr:unnamed protein product [Rhizophagus irregularis]